MADIKYLDKTGLGTVKSILEGLFSPKGHKHTVTDITNFPSSMPASDVYDWAKAATKPSYSFNEINPGVATIGDGANRLMFRTHESYRNGMYYSTPGNEALVFATKNSVTSWIFATADPNTQTAWNSLTPSLQIKNGRVTINKLIPEATNAAYNLDVNGSANATTLYENGTRVALSGHTHDDRYYTEGEIDTKLAGKSNTGHGHDYLPLAGGTMEGNVTWKAGTGGASCFPAHIYRNTYDTDGNVYDHYYKSDISSTNSFANLRVKSGTSFKLLRFGGDGTFTWDSKAVSLAGHGHTKSQITDFPSSLPANGGNADTVGGKGVSDFARFYLSPMSSGAPADSAKSWFTDTMPSGSGAIVYNVPGAEKTIIAGKSSGAFGHMLQLNYDDNYLRILRYYSGSWKTTDWEKISAGYADTAGSAVDQTARNSAAAKWTWNADEIKAVKVNNASSADSATKATKDSDGNTINTTYLKLEGGTMTGNILLGNGNAILGSGNSIPSKFKDSASISPEVHSVWLAAVGTGTGNSAGSEASGILFDGNTIKLWSPLDADPQIIDSDNGSAYTLLHSGNISSHAITSLSGYATQDWVTNKGYTTATGHNHDGRYAWGDYASQTNLSDCNAVDSTGFWTHGGFTNRPEEVANWGSLMNIRLYNSNNNYHRQLFFDCYGSDKIWTRSDNGGSWTTWKELSLAGHTHSEYAASSHGTHITSDAQTWAGEKTHSSRSIFTGGGAGSSSISYANAAMTIGTVNHSGTVGDYYPGIAFNHMYTYNSGASYRNHAHAWIGLKLHSTPTAELSYLIFATNNDITNGTSPKERMSIAPDGTVNIINNLTVDGTITTGGVKGNSTSNNLEFRHLDGQNCNGDYNLYLQYHQSSAKTYFNGTTYYIKGSYYNGTAENANNAANADKLDNKDSSEFLQYVTQNATFSSVANISTDLTPGIHKVHISGVEYSSILTGKDYNGSYWQLYFHPTSGYTEDIKYRATNCSTWKTLLDSNNSSVDLTGKILTVKINGTSKAVTVPTAAVDIGALKNYGADNSRPNSTTFTLPSGANTVQMRSGATSGADVGIFHLSDDNAFICNSSDTAYLFATFDTDKTADFSSSGNAAFAVLSNHEGVVAKGKISCDSGFFDTSDERLKDFYDDIDVDFDKLRAIPKKYFSWKDDESKEIHLGTSAQEIQKVYPEIVNESADGELSVNYSKLSVVALAAVDKLYDKINRIEQALIDKGIL